ncbi:hypothetical protein ANOM_005602, partial [Aspergillus nomiae NRRL 13137]
MAADKSQPSESSSVDSVASITQHPSISYDRVLRSRNTNNPPPPTAQSLFNALKGSSRRDDRFFTTPELDEVLLLATCRFDNFPVPWQSIYIEPDMVFVYGSMNLPTVLVEVGYSQSWPSLIQDKDVCFQAAPTVNVVVLVKWNKRTNSTVAGYLELFRRGAPTPTHIVRYFSYINTTRPQTLTFRRDDVYPPGTTLPAGRSPNDLWQWDIDNLRMMSIRAMSVD